MIINLIANFIHITTHPIHSLRTFLHELIRLLLHKLLCKLNTLFVISLLTSLKKKSSININNQLLHQNMS